jgi:O-methyltransferase involved in polyketide biosynthesis
VDFEANELRARLLDAGFTQQAVTFFLWEGVSYFLREGAVRRVLELVAESSLGSGVCFDYALRRFVEGDTSFYGAAAVRRWSEQANEPLRFGLDAGELAPLVRAYGMRVELDLDGPGLERAYLLRKNGKVAGRVLEPYRYAHVINDAGRAGC